MAMYMAICRQRSLGIHARKEMEAAFRRSNPVEGQQLFMSLDGRTSFALVETDDPTEMAAGFAQFAPYADYEVHQVVGPRESMKIQAMASEVWADE